MPVGYTFELRVGSVDAVATELRAPTLVGAEVAATCGFDLDEEVVDRWDELAQDVARRTTSGSTWLGDGEDEGATMYVLAVVTTMTHWYGSLAHSSSGGEAFREFLEGPADDALGGGLVHDLSGRELAGLLLDVLPSVGWAGNAELRAAVARGLPDDCGHLGPEDEDDLVQLIACVERAAAGGLDLFAVHD